MTIIRDEKSLPLIVHTGKFTGRSPKDRYFVKNKENENTINWGAANQPISEKIYAEVYQKIHEHLIQKKLIISFKGNVISDKKNSYAYRIY